MNMRLTALTAGLGLSLLAGSAFAGQVVEYEDWLYGEQADQALDYAQEHDLPVVMIKMFRETDCPLCMGASRTMSSAKPNKQMIRIMYYVGAGSEELNTERTRQLYRKVAGQVTDPSNWAPDMYYTTIDGLALGFVAYEQANESRAEGTKVLQIAEWINSIPGEVAKADRSAERGRYAQAVEEIDEIVKRDAQVSHLIQIQVGNASEDDAMPDTPATQFFPDLRQEKLEEYQAMAQAELDAARQLVVDEKLREAQRALRTLSRGPEDFETTDAAKKLLEEVVEKLRG